MQAHALTHARRHEERALGYADEHTERRSFVRLDVCACARLAEYGEHAHVETEHICRRFELGTLAPGGVRRARIDKSRIAIASRVSGKRANRVDIWSWSEYPSAVE